MSAHLEDAASSNPLCGAARAGHADAPVDLPAYGWPAIQGDQSFEYTPLHRAAEAGDSHEVKQRIALGDPVESLDGECRTPLHLAADRDHLDVCRILLEHDHGVLHLSMARETSLDLAVLNGHHRIVGLILKRHGRAFCDERLEYMLVRAIRNGHREVVQALLDHGVTVDNGRNDDAAQLCRLAEEQLSAAERADLADVELRLLRAENRALHRLSLCDSLTGIGNRRFFEREIVKQWQGAIEASTWLCIILVDVDEFKAYNQFNGDGHRGGDLCLRRIAEALATTAAQQAGRVARLGGDEFVILVAGQSPALPGRYLDSVRNLGICHKGLGKTDCCSVSVGGAAVRPEPGDRWDDALRRADAALFSAKRLGGNRVVWAAPEQEGDGHATQ